MPVFVETLIAGTDIHVAWRVEAIVVAAVVIPTDSSAPPHRHHRSERDVRECGRDGPVWTLREAASTGMFWTIAAGLAVSGMLSTALAFHQVAVLVSKASPQRKRPRTSSRRPSPDRRHPDHRRPVDRSHLSTASRSR